MQVKKKSTREGDHVQSFQKLFVSISKEHIRYVKAACDIKQHQHFLDCSWLARTAQWELRYWCTKSMIIALLAELLKPCLKQAALIVVFCCDSYSLGEGEAPIDRIHVSDIVGVGILCNKLRVGHTKEENA